MIYVWHMKQTFWGSSLLISLMLNYGAVYIYTFRWAKPVGNDRLKNDIDLVTRVLSEDGLALQQMSRSIRANRALVLTLGESLESFSPVTQWENWSILYCWWTEPS